MLIRLQYCLLADWTRAADCRLFYREGQGPSNRGFYIKYYINIQIPIFIWDYDLNLGRKELGIVSIVREPNYPWFDRNSQPKPDRPRGKKWVGKNDGSHTSSKTIVACFTTADLTPAFITGPVEPGLMGEETTVCPLTPPTFSRTRRKTFFLKNLLILHSGSLLFLLSAGTASYHIMYITFYDIAKVYRNTRGIQSWVEIFPERKSSPFMKFSSLLCTRNTIYWSEKLLYPLITNSILKVRITILIVSSGTYCNLCWILSKRSQAKLFTHSNPKWFLERLIEIFYAKAVQDIRIVVHNFEWLKIITLLATKIKAV